MQVKAFFVEYVMQTNQNQNQQPRPKQQNTPPEQYALDDDVARRIEEFPVVFGD